MKKYKVHYTWYDGDAWYHEDRTEIVEAESAEEAKKRIEGMTSPCDDYVVSLVEEAKDDNCD